MESEGLALCRCRRHVRGRRPDGLGLAGHFVPPNHVAVLRLGVDDARIAQVRNRHKSIATLDLEPVVVHDSARLARPAGTAPVVVVLHPTTDVVRRLHVVADMVEQSDRQVRHEFPRFRHVVGCADTAVATDDHVLGIVRIDPDRVDIIVDHERRTRFEGAPAVNAHLHLDAAHVETVRRSWIDANLAEVHRPRIDDAHPAPRLATVVRAIEAGDGVGRSARAAASAATSAAGPFDGREDDVGAPAIHVQCDSSERSCRKAARLLRPGFSAIDGLPDATSGTAAVHAAGGAPPLVHRREQDSRVRLRAHQVVRPGVLITLEYTLPTSATVRRLVDPPIPSGPEQRPRGRNENHVVVAGIEHDAVDVL